MRIKQKVSFIFYHIIQKVALAINKRPALYGYMTTFCPLPWDEKTPKYSPVAPFRPLSCPPPVPPAPPLFLRDDLCVIYV